MSIPSLGSPTLLFNGKWGSFLGEKQPNHEVDSSPPSSAKVKNEWGHTSNSPYMLFMAWTGKTLPFTIFYSLCTDTVHTKTTALTVKQNIWIQNITGITDSEKQQQSDKSLSPCYFVHHKSHTVSPEIEPKPLWWEASIITVIMAPTMVNTLSEAIIYEWCFNLMPGHPPHSEYWQQIITKYHFCSGPQWTV
jgi:hypothetical protein